MGDLAQDFKQHNERRKERHAEWHKINRKNIDDSGVPYTDRGEALLFRERGMPVVDFYPSTGRWKVAGDRALSGGALKFLKWYRGHKK